MIRRFLAHLIDLSIALPAAGAILWCFSHAFNRDLTQSVPILFLVVCILFALFERYYGGMTPGRFLFRQHLANVSDRSLPTFQVLFLRASILYLATDFLSEIIDFCMRWLLGVDSRLPVSNFVWWVATFILMSPLLFTLGSQTLPDVLLGTSVYTFTQKRPARVMRPVYLIPILVTTFVSLILVSYLASTNKGIAADAEGEIEESVDDGLAMVEQLQLEPSELEPGIKGLYRYVAPDGQGPGMDNGERSVRIRRHVASLLDIQNFPIDRPVVRYTVFVTWLGLIDSDFQWRIARNITRALSARGAPEVCEVSFIYYDSFFNAFHPVVLRTLVAVNGRQIVVVLPSEEPFIVGSTTAKAKPAEVLISVQQQRGRGAEKD